MKKKLLDSVSIEELRQMYESGMSYRDIANSLEVSYQTIYTHLKGLVGPRGRGGYHARKIQGGQTSQPQAQKIGMPEMRVQNSASACLVVLQRTITLKGTVGEYLVEPAKATVVASIGDNLVNLGFDIIPGLIEELKAIGRNIESVTTGNEMW